MQNYFIPNIFVGETVDNTRIVEEFGCNPQGGMRRSSRTNTLVIISKHIGVRGKYYDDKFIDGVYYYTGQGLIGNQDLGFMQNKTLSQSSSNGVGVHLFEVFKEKEYIYQGRVKLASEPIQSDQEDIEGAMRKVWVFPLTLIEDANPSTYVSSALLDEVYNQQEKSAKLMKLDELARSAKLASSPASSRKSYAKTYFRSPYIAEYTRVRAGGVCELCRGPAPFTDRTGRSYLESHHIQWLSKGGPDSIENTVALCPNCHKRMHVVDSPEDVESLAKLRVAFKD